MAEEPDLNFIAAQIDRLLTDTSMLREDIREVTAIMLQINNTANALLAKIRNQD
jgi:hypothetical protein